METPTPLPNKKLSLRNKVEAILFSVGGRIALKDITRLSKSREDAVLEALKDLREYYSGKDSSLLLIEDGSHWKLSVRDPYLPVVKKIVTETELTKTVLETLAIIAFKYPILQSDLIKLRTNKAYDHLKELEEQGFVSRKRHGRTNLIKLTEKFFQYFDLPPDKLKDQFKDFESIASVIATREGELHLKKEELAKMRLDDSQKEKRINEEIASLDSKAEPKIETYGNSANETEPKLEQHLGDLEVYDEPKEGASKEQPKKKTTEKKSDADSDSSDDPTSSEEETKGNEGEDEKSEESEEDTVAQEEESSEDERNSSQEQEESDSTAQSDQEEETDDKETEEEEKPLKNSNQKNPQNQPPKKKGPGISTTPEMEEAIDRKVEEMLHPKKDENEIILPSQQQDDVLEEALGAAKKRRKEEKERS